MTENYVKVILDAIDDLKKDTTLTVESDDVSTMLFGPSRNVFRALKTCFVKASKQTEHVVMDVTFSHGCPGEPTERCCAAKHTGAPTGEKKTLTKEEPTGITAAAQFALYPLNSQKYMDVIYEEIEQAKKLVNVSAKHYCTRLDGDVSDILTAIRQSLENAICSVPHVVVTAILSKH